MALLNYEKKYIYKFPENIASKSTIFMDDSLIYMVNKGFAFVGNRQINYGTPFIASFEKQTGKQKHLKFG